MSVAVAIPSLLVWAAVGVFLFLQLKKRGVFA